MSSAEHEAWRRRRDEIIERYGDADAATEACAREKLLLTAVAPWRTTSEGWTISLDGWRGSGQMYREMSARALRAIRDAYMLPATFSEAKAENAYWQTRNAELRDVLSEDGLFVDDVALDLVAEVRATIVRDLALYELPVSTIKDLRDRITIYREARLTDLRSEEVLFRDVAAMAEAVQTQPSSTRTDIADRVRVALCEDPSRSDRDLARSLRCSPTTVGKARAAMGLRSTTRAVSRGGRRFEMRVATAQTADAG